MTEFLFFSTPINPLCYEHGKPYLDCEECTHDDRNNDEDDKPAA